MLAKYKRQPLRKVDRVSCWLLLTLFCFTLSGCRFGGQVDQRAPTPGAVPVPTFTATPVLAATSTAMRDSVTPQPVTLYQKMAYVRQKQLIITTYPQGEIYVADQCAQNEQPCSFSHLAWSPTSRHLAYFKSIFTPEGANTGLYVLDEENQSHPVTTTTQPMLDFSPAWSPDGRSLAYIVGSMNIVQLPETAVSSTTGISSGNLAQLSDVWVSHFPFTDPGVRSGSIQVFTGFGSYSLTESEALYGQEGLSSGPVGPGLQLHWLPTDRLLFTRSPLRVGIGQFDLHSGQELAPLDSNELRQFAIHPLGQQQSQQLAAWTWDGQITVGNTDGTMRMTHPIPGVTDPRLTSPITGSVSAGAVFWGPTSRRLYFTTRTFGGSLAIDAAHYLALYPDLPLFGPIPSAFDVYHSALFAVNDDDFAQLQPLLASADYGYGSLTEAANGDILFVRIENGIPLLEAINAQLPPAEVMKHVPQASIMRLVAGGEKLEIVVENAGQLALASVQ